MELEYCVYKTTYKGCLLPKYYIGSTSLKKIKSNNYFGSVSSKKWKYTFKNELKNNIQLFYIEILSYHSTRQDALEEELKIQIENNVVKSNDYMNESLAIINGMFGRDVKGEYNPMFGKKRDDVSVRMSGDNNIAKRNDVKEKLRKPKSKITPHKHSEETKSKLKNAALNRSDEVKNNIKKGLNKRSDIKYADSIDVLVPELLKKEQLTKQEIIKIFNDKDYNFIKELLRIGKNRNIIYCKVAGVNSTWHLKK